jgi:hypothetical protein
MMASDGATAASVEALRAEVASAEAEALLLTLRGLPCVRGVRTKPAPPANKPNHFGITFELHLPGQPRQTKRMAVTGADGARPTFVAAVRSAIKAVNAALVEANVTSTSDATPAPLAPPTAEELEWLAEWMDSQLAPEEITTEQAAAALAQRRSASSSSKAGSSEANSSEATTAGSATMFSQMHEVQLQRAQLAAARRKVERVNRQIERLEAAMPDVRAEKRARVREPATDGVPDHPRMASGGSNPPNWSRYHSYSQATYQKLETEEQDRRAVEIDRNQRECVLPHGDESRGWFDHWRRGVGGALRGWAKGSLGAIIHMLAVSARNFDVVDELGAELGFSPKADMRRAETCIYAVGRARAMLSVLKWSKTEEQHEDYHTVLTALAARRSTDGADADGMIERVADELGVTAGKRCASACPARPLPAPLPCPATKATEPRPCLTCREGTTKPRRLRGLAFTSSAWRAAWSSTRTC